MSERRFFVVGDIHGSYEKLKAILANLDWAPGSGDQLIFLGDYIDRGPQSYDVVQTVAELADRRPDVIALKGNHESMFLDFIGGRADPQLFANGLSATVRDYSRAEGGLSVQHLNFYRGLALCHETEEYIFVHAGLAPGLPLARQSAHDMLWVRDEFLLSDYDFGKTVVFGHTPFKEPFVAPGRLGLDTGAVFGGPLTAVVLPEMRFIYAE
ncbi:MAG: serine/threonine protein phosphatase [Candidatus Adiutrix sp.]|jgi:serine/threonine protein phosphatase 1|nr:serine/threonine protein phosphatase [Candidatus Adiutrix sp.]